MPKATARRPKPEDFEPLFELILAEALSQNEACRRMGLHSPAVSTAIGADPELRQRYEAIRRQRADVYGEKVGEIVDKVIAKKITPDAARVAIMGLQWTAGRMAPDRWGNKVEVQHSGGVKVTRIELVGIEPAPRNDDSTG